jgi:hypothetical protein
MSRLLSATEARPDGDGAAELPLLTTVATLGSAFCCSQPFHRRWWWSPRAHRCSWRRSPGSGPPGRQRPPSTWGQSGPAPRFRTSHRPQRGGTAARTRQGRAAGTAIPGAITDTRAHASPSFRVQGKTWPHLQGVGPCHCPFRSQRTWSTGATHFSAASSADWMSPVSWTLPWSISWSSFKE